MSRATLRALVGTAALSVIMVAAASLFARAPVDPGPAAVDSGTPPSLSPVRSVGQKSSVSRHSQRAVDPQVVEGFGADRTATAASLQICVQPPENCQLPDQLGHGSSGTIGATSDTEAGFTVAERFVLDLEGSIGSLCFWGAYLNFTTGDCSDPLPDDNFTITFYQNVLDCPDGLPGEVLAGPYSVTANRVATGQVIGSGLGDLNEYEYTVNLTIAPFVEAGQCFWIAVQNDTFQSPDCLWLWTTAPGDGASYQFGSPTPANDFDLAVCLNEPLGSTDGCFPDCPILPLCDDTPNCQVYGTLNAFNSTPGQFLSADDFTVVADGSISSPCWQGLYPDTPPIDSFRIRYMGDAGGYPDETNVLGNFSQALGTLSAPTRLETGLSVVDLPVYQYSASHAPVSVLEGECYWIEISNDVDAAGSSWFWDFAEVGPYAGNLAAPPREGNGRLALDGVGALDGYDAGDLVADRDLAFCLGVELAGDSACDFRTLFDTGPHETVTFNGTTTNLGWSSGDLEGGPGADDQRRTAQAFALPAADGDWSIEQIIVEGFDPGGAVNERINVSIFTRTALDVAPTDADLVCSVLNVPFVTADDIDPDTTRIIVQPGAGACALAGGDYWLTFWASNASGGLSPANLAWFTNAPDGINNFCTTSFPPPAPGFDGCSPSDPDGAAPGTPAMLRARLYPAPGFGGYVLDPTVLSVDPIGDPTPDPADLYNAAILIRGTGTPASCIPDVDGNEIVDFQDLLIVLANWGPCVGCPADLDDDDDVDFQDLLIVLANWGPCV